MLMGGPQGISITPGVCPSKGGSSMHSFIPWYGDSHMDIDNSMDDDCPRDCSHPRDGDYPSNSARPLDPHICVRDGDHPKVDDRPLLCSL